MSVKWLNDSNVLTDREYSNWIDCIKECGNLLVNAGNIDNKYIESMIETVYKFGPYMIIVPEICLFHGLMSEGVNSTGLSLVVLNKEVVFSDFENQRIKCAFAFAAKDSNSHLEMLKYLSGLLVNEDLLYLLRNNGSKEEIIKLIDKLGETNETY